MNEPAAYRPAARTPHSNGLIHLRAPRAIRGLTRELVVDAHRRRLAATSPAGHTPGGRELLANAANQLLNELRDGAKPAPEPLRKVAFIGEEDTDDHAAAVRGLVTELTALGCAEPEVDTEIADPVNGAVLAVAEAFWPAGLQPGLGDPVVLELDPGAALPRLSELGYQVFTSTDALRHFVTRRNAESAGELLTMSGQELAGV